MALVWNRQDKEAVVVALRWGEHPERFCWVLLGYGSGEPVATHCSSAVGSYTARSILASSVQAVNRRGGWGVPGPYHTKPSR